MDLRLKSMNIIEVPTLPIQDLHKRLGYSNPLDYPDSSLSKPLSDWKMDIDDSLILRYLYRNFRPRRHLEFGTWEGIGSVCCLEECNATVWTINLLEGEKSQDGSWSYNKTSMDLDNLPQWSKKRKYYEDLDLYQTDSYGFIGRYYLEKGYGNRVCQIYCDSREWDISNYPDGFFDTVLIDGGHNVDVVTYDTEKALKLLRSGGLILWHDFCPKADVCLKNSTVRSVVRSLQLIWNQVINQTQDLFWIDPSWILLGVKR
jgi:predicted O-methyltransferase YrrM